MNKMFWRSAKIDTVGPLARRLVAAWLVAVSSAGAVSAEAPDFERDIAPLLIRNCLSCHNGSDPAGELDLTTPLRLQQGGESGEPAIVPGDSGRSHLFDRLRDGEMPPEGKGRPLSAEQLELVRRWIEAGAVWPADRTLSPFELTTDTRAGRDWWSLRPTERGEVPSPSGAARVRTPIDAFVLAALEDRGLEFSPDADRPTLIRRATVDLWGLLPTPEEVESFAADPFPDAYERLIDRLLDSPRYGECWGQHWLDVARFAESQGYETNQARPNAWRYRDYVIDALNRDIPYSQFIVEQLAGDQCRAGAATGFLVAGAHDIVASPDIELTRQQRHNDLDDMVSTTSMAFMGMTIGCAKCHDHKFDPLSQRDYYGLQAVFAGVQHGERDEMLELDATQRKQQDALRAELQVLDARMRQLAVRSEPLAQPNRPLESGQPPRAPVQVQGNVERFAPVRARFVRFTVLAAAGGSEPCIDEFEVFAAGTGENVGLAVAGAKASASSVYAGGGLPLHQLAHLNDGKFGNSWSWISEEQGAGWIQIEFPQPVEIDRVEWARDREGKFLDRLATRYRLEVASEPDKWQTVADETDRRAVGSTAAPAETPAQDNADAAELARLRTQVDELRERVRTGETRRLYAGVFLQPHAVYRLQRGEVLQPREPVAPATPASIGTPMSIAPDAADPQRRQALAQWLTSPTHPLTSRVAVNRLWFHHFGRGLVATPNDFGFNGGRPSNPKLLDWLATEFVRSGWRPKYMHRLMMTSTAYRQSSRLVPAAVAVDAGGELLWRYRPYRLSAEAIHDAILCTAGTMDFTAGGPGYEVFIPDNVNTVRVFEPKPTLGPADWRRMVYENKPRMRAEPTFGVFDCPDASQSVARRNVSTTALQSLSLLNSSFVMDQATQLAARLQRERPGELDAQLQRAFQLCFSRPAAGDELKLARTLAVEHGLAGFCRAILNCNEFIYVR